jgi:hypothetical protein
MIITKRCFYVFSEDYIRYVDDGEYTEYRMYSQKIILQIIRL